MQSPEQPANEAERLASLKRLLILDTPAEERFDRITRIAQRVLGTEIALVSLVDGQRQWFKSKQGLLASETPRDVSFCGHAILDDKAFVVNDATQDARFADNPLVTGDPNVRFYAGQPLHAPDGHRIGTLCVIDPRPRALSTDDVDLLGDLAALVEKELRLAALSENERRLRTQLAESERRASIDGLTGLWNRATIDVVLEAEVKRALASELAVGIMMLDIDHFKKVNDTHGHQAGDDVLRAVAQRVRRSLREVDAVGRYGGEEFLVILPDASVAEAMLVAERVRDCVAANPVKTPHAQLDVTVSIGVWTGAVPPRTATASLTRAADQALYAAKAAGRNRVVCSSVSDPSGVTAADAAARPGAADTGA